LVAGFRIEGEKVFGQGPIKEKATGRKKGENGESGEGRGRKTQKKKKQRQKTKKDHWTEWYKAFHENWLRTRRGNP